MEILVGGVLASFMGTTGASMLLIRPLIRANDNRKSNAHVVIFFIFIVSNIGGSLTPLGDPPLFLGFLHGVPFFWVTKALLPHALTAVAILLVVFFILDSYWYRKEPVAAPADGHDGQRKGIRIEGLHNLVFLLGIMWDFWFLNEQCSARNMELARPAPRVERPVTF